jgi:hypothetical protein
VGVGREPVEGSKGCEYKWAWEHGCQNDDLKFETSARLSVTTSTVNPGAPTDRSVAPASMGQPPITDCELMRIENKAMKSALHSENELSDMFVAYLLGRNIRYEEDLVDQLFNSSEKRLARLLLLLARFGKDGQPEKVIPKISQETLAEMVGTTRSRISFFMNRFRKLGFVRYNGELEIHSSLLNVVLHDSPDHRA